MSMGLLALAVTFVIADNLATSYSMKGITNGLTAVSYTHLTSSCSTKSSRNESERVR